MVHCRLMGEVVPILFGAAFTVAACLSAGRILLSRLQIKLFRGEEWLFRFVTGAAIVSFLVFLLAVAGWLGRGTLLALGIVCLAGNAFALPSRSIRLPDFPGPWKLLFWALFLPFTVLYFVQALGPEYSPDGSSYHLGYVARYLAQGGFGRITTSVYANLSQGLELLFAMAFAFGRHSAAALVHFVFLLTLAAGVLSYARRSGDYAAGICAAILIYLSPVFGGDGTAAYNDVAAGCVIFFLFYLLEIWDGQRHPGLLIPSGLLAGLAYAIKYTAFPAVFFALGYVLWRARRIRPAAIVALWAALMIAPWMVKDAITVGNPFSPFLNRWFPNPYTNVAMEQEYGRTNGIHRDGFSFAGSIADMTVHGHLSRSLLGPVYLLAPLALISLGRRGGRRLLAAAAIFAAVWPANVDTRFLIPAAPFVALAIGLVLARLPATIPLVLLAHAWLSWPTVVRRYCDPLAMRVQHFLPREALRLVPEDSTLRYRLPGYAAARFIEQMVPPGGRVFALSKPPEAYTTRDVLVYWEASFNEAIEDVLLMPLRPETQPLWRWRFELPRGRRSFVRIVQDATDAGAQWSVGEVHLWNRGAELERGWKLRTQPNPWDAGWAQDGNPLTRWRSLDTLKPGMHVDCKLDGPREIDAVTLDCAHDQWSLRLHVEDEQGNVLARDGSRSEIAISADLRPAAVREIVRRGITHLLLRDADFGADDFRRNAAAWGITLAGEADGWRLYRLR